MYGNFTLFNFQGYQTVSYNHLLTRCFCVEHYVHILHVNGIASTQTDVCYFVRSEPTSSAGNHKKNQSTGILQTTSSVSIWLLRLSSKNYNGKIVMLHAPATCADVTPLFSPIYAYFYELTSRSYALKKIHENIHDPTKSGIQYPLNWF